MPASFIKKLNKYKYKNWRKKHAEGNDRGNYS